MDKYKVTITENGNVNIPSKVKMTIPEVADLFGVFYQTTKREVRAIEKSGIAGGDLSSACIVEGNNIYSEYYGLDMIIALAFRVQSPNADIFRGWVINKVIRSNVVTTLVLSLQNAILN
ncbi:hypothetical protein [Dysgonomonas capnocytophagoides]|uniref:hypothetical protein n=1 Tax=Dysgonomonas capnocytophagoides TaxID=45254 RepID=UPI0039930AA9